MTIKKRIVIWYTLWMALLVIAAAVVFVSASGVMMQREVIKNLEEVVHDAAEDIRIRNGRLFWDDVDFFDDGVYISIWKDGEIISGRFPEEAPFAAISIDSIQDISDENGSWYFLDIPLGENYFIRGAERAYDMGLILSSMHLMVIILLPLILILAAFGGYVIVRRSFAPADKVIATAGDIADSDDLSKRIALGSGNDEIHQMAFAFDLMLDRIEEAFEKEKQFTSDASHELKTPLSTIRLLSDSILQAEHMDADMVREFVRDIGQEAERLTNITEDLLRLTRLDSGVVEEAVPVEVWPVVQAVCRSLRLLADDKHIALELSVEQPCWVRATKGEIHQVIYNLVENAIKYNTDGGFVRVLLSADDTSAYITVEDNGIGIPDEDLDHVFERFYRVDKARSRAAGGTGLGLSIVRDTVRRRGGRIQADHRVGGGTVFTIEMPRAEEEQP